MITMHAVSWTTPKETFTPQVLHQADEFNQCLGQVLENKVGAFERFDYMSIIREHLNAYAGEYQPNLGTFDLQIRQFERILCACQVLHDWPLEIFVRKILQKKYLNVQKKPDIESKNLTNTLGLIQAYLYCGEFHRADNELVQAFLAWPTEPQLDCIDDKIDKVFFDYPYQWNDLEKGELRLTPMTAEHMHSFAWQYADATIGELCNLPDFTSNQQWLDWLYNCSASSGHHLFAIIHKEWGFIGSVCLEMDDDIGFFYYWLGRDFQGNGFGPDAVKILLQVGRQYHGMQSCYAKVLKHNEISQRGLHKIGFKQLPYSFAEPNDKEFLYYLGPDKKPAGQFFEAQKTFLKFDNGRQIVPWNLSEFYV